MSFLRQISAAFSLCFISAFCHAQIAPVNPGNGVNPVTQAAVNAGVLACASRINQVSQFVANGSQMSAFFFAPPGQPDQRMTSFSFELQSPNTPTVYASASFAPNQANGCGAVYEAVVYWPQKCDVVASKQYAEMKKGRAMQKEIIVMEGGAASSRIFLMPAGSGCVSIKKEVVL